MNWTRPVPLLVPGMVVLVPLAPLLPRPVWFLHLVAEAVIITLAVIAFVWLGWLVHWWHEQRW